MKKSEMIEALARRCVMQYNAYKCYQGKKKEAERRKSFFHGFFLLSDILREYGYAIIKDTVNGCGMIDLWHLEKIEREA